MNHKYIILTTVDITPTGVVINNSKDYEVEFKRNQQRNYDTLCQVVSLRANIHDPEVEQHNVSSADFLFPNPNLPDEFACWSFTFYCDREDVFGENNRALLDDLHMVPIVPALNETVSQFPPYFISYGDLRNVYIT